MTTTIGYFDTNPLIYIAKGGGQQALIDYFRQNPGTVITDVVRAEATIAASPQPGKEPLPDAIDLKNFFDNHADLYVYSDTGLQNQADNGLLPSTKNLGERSIIADAEAKGYSPSSVKIITEDTTPSRWVTSSGTDFSSSLISTGKEVANSSISNEQKANIRNSLSDAGIKSSSEIGTDSQLGESQIFDKNASPTDAFKYQSISDPLTSGETVVDPYHAASIPAGIDPSSAVTKSYGDFVNEARSLGASEGALNGLGAVADGLNALGAGALAYAGFEAATQALGQANAGDYAGATKTVADFGASVIAGDIGAGIGEVLGGAATAGLAIAAGAAAPEVALAGAAGALVGAAIGGYEGFVNGSGVLDGIIGGFSSFLSAASGVLHDAGVGSGLSFGRDSGPGGAANGGPLGPGGAPGTAGKGVAKGQQQVSPLVLDLAGTGLNLKALSSFSPYFDLSATGFEAKSSWIGKGTGLLVLDRNNDGKINDGTELFGTAGGSADGFAALRLLDTNGDGLISAADAQFNDLRVWVNPEGDGIAYPGELLSLTSLGIVSINLAATASTQVIAGDAIKLVSTYTLANGTTRTIADAWLTTSATFTKPDTTPIIPADIAALPQLQGYGRMTDLRSAMVADPALKTLVQAFAAGAGAPDATTLGNITSIMLEWSGSTAIDPASRGGEFDGRKLDFLEKYTGIPFVSGDAGSGPRWRGAITLNSSWTAAENSITARLLLTSGYLLPEFTYNTAADFILPTTSLAASVSALYARLGDVTAANVGTWEVALRVIDAYRIDSHSSTDTILNAIATNSSASVASFASAIEQSLAYVPAAAGVPPTGTSGASLSGVTENAIIFAGSATRQISLQGQPTASPPTLNDTIRYHAGDGLLSVNIVDFSDTPTNTLLLSGIAPGSAKFSFDAGGELVVTDGVAGDTVSVTNATLLGANGVQQVTFDDRTSLTRQQVINLAETGSSANLSLYGTVAADTIDSKGLATYAQGNGGADNYIYNSGYKGLEINADAGADVYGDGYASTATLLLGAGITAASLQVSNDANGNMLLTDNVTGDLIKLDGELTANKGVTEFGVASVTFADASVLTRSQLIGLADTGSSTNITLYGTPFADVFDSKGFATYAQGNGGADSFIYKSGYHALEINEDAGANFYGNGYTSSATLQLGSGITAANLQASSDANGNMFLTDGVSGDQIKLDAEMNTNGGVAEFGVASLTFADNSTLTRAQLITLADTGTAKNKLLYGTSAADVFDSKGFATYAQGNGGADSFIYKSGYHTLEINEDAGANWYGNGYTSTATLQLGTGITAANLQVSSDASGNMFITDGVTGDQIKLDSEMNTNGGVSEFGVASLTFADNSTLTRAQLITLADTGTATNKLLYGTPAADVFDSKGFATYAQGNGGADSFIYKSGYHALEINEDAGANFYGNGYTSSATLQLGSGITAANLKVTSDAKGNMFLTDGVSGDQIKLDGEMNANGGVSEFGIASLRFSNNAVLTRAQLITLADTGSATNKLLYGTSAADVFDSKGFATYAQGNGGADSFFYKSGYHSLEINEDAGSNFYGDGYTSAATLRLGTGITSANLKVSSDSNGNMLLKDGVTGDQIKLDAELLTNNGVAEYGVESLTFADNSTLTRAQLIALIPPPPAARMATAGSSTSGSMLTTNLVSPSPMAPSTAPGAGITPQPPTTGIAGSVITSDPVSARTVGSASAVPAADLLRQSETMPATDVTAARALVDAAMGQTFPVTAMHLSQDAAPYTSDHDLTEPQLPTSRQLRPMQVAGSGSVADAYLMDSRLQRMLSAMADFQSGDGLCAGQMNISGTKLQPTLVELAVALH